MPSDQKEIRRRDQLLAMRDASAEAFEAARAKYFRLLRHMELVSIEYVLGKCERALVRALAEQLLETEFKVSETARQTRLYQEGLDKLIISSALNRKTPEKHRPKARRHRYLELLTVPGR